MQDIIIDEKIVSPYHPLENYKLPKRTFGKSNRTCQSSWFKTYEWLHYVTQNDAVICYTCANQELSGSLRSETKKDPAFRKATEKFKDKSLIVIKQLFHLRLQFASAEMFR